jgi:hypothetical protein
MGKVTGGAHEKGFQFPKGGSGKMFGKQEAGLQREGVTSHEVSSSGGKFPMGGKGKMFGPGRASPAEPGVTAKKSQ